MAFSWRRANPVGSLVLLRSHPELLGLAAVNFLGNVAHASLPSVFVLYVGYRYGWDAQTVGIMLAGVGIASVIVQAGVISPVVRRIGERAALLLGLVCGAVGFAAYGLAPTGILFLLGVPAAFMLTRGEARGRGAFLALILSPLIIPRIVVAVAIYVLYARIGLVGTSAGLVLGHTVLAVPYVVITMMAVLKTYDERLDQAAASLGASPWRTLLHVTFPLIRAGMIASFLFAFITSFDELTIAIFISGGIKTTLPKQMWDDMILQLNPTLAAVSVVVFVVVTAMLLVAERFRSSS